MKKTIPTSIAHTLFYVEEDAYQKLEKYLAEVRRYFSTYDDSAEIVQDIESRIREQLLEASETTKTSDKIVTEAHVDTLIKTMGWPEEFAQDTSPSKEETPIKSKRKKLYRDTDNAIIGGVAAGLGSYFGIDPIIIRIAFFISSFFGGLGTAIYIIIWFSVPEASSPTQKLEMEGNPVTLDEVKKIIEEKITEIDGKEKLKKGSSKLVRFLRTVIVLFSKIFGKLFGSVLRLIALIGTCALVTVLLISVMEAPFSISGWTFHSGVISYLLIAVGFLLCVIPFLLLGIGGSILKNKKKSSKMGTLVRVLAGIWILALIVTAVGTVHIAKHRSEYIRLAPHSAQATKTIPITGVSKLTIRNGQQVHITQGPTPSLEIQGQEIDISRTKIESIGDTLSISTDPFGEPCFFCTRSHTEIFITLPSLSTLAIHNGSRVSFDGTLTAISTTIENGSELTLTGSTQSFGVILRNASRMNAENFIVSKLEVSMENGSEAHVNATERISGKLANGSRLQQYGKAPIENLETENGSRAEKR